MKNLILKTSFLTQRIRDLFKGLIEPNKAVMSIRRRNRLRMLSGILLFLTPFTLTGALFMRSSSTSTGSMRWLVLLVGAVFLVLLIFLLGSEMTTHLQ